MPLIRIGHEEFNMSDQEYADYTRQIELREIKRKREEETNAAMLGELGGNIPRFILGMCKKLNINPEDIVNG